MQINCPPFPKSNNIAVKLQSKAELKVIQGHPWVFTNSIVKINKEPITGDLAIIFSKKNNQVIAFGLFDMQSEIRIKIIQLGNKLTLNETYFKNNVGEALSKRKSLLQTNTNSYRLLFGENDGFPGFIADVYAKVLVVKLYTGMWLPYLKDIIKQLITVSNCKTVILRLSRSLQQDKNFVLKDGAILYGELKNPVIIFKEHGVNFSAHVLKGHKTGYFLDHRLNRKEVGERSKNKTVLDVFSYAGGFSVHALANGAKQVTSLDVSKEALKLAIANGKLNNNSGEHLTIAGDAFVEMQKLIAANKTFDVVVIDPPSFAKQQKEITLAKKKYAQLARLGERLTAKNGLLVLASCSSRILAQSFWDINKQNLLATNRQYQCILKTQHDVDHPVTFPEGAYLKCGYYKFKDT